MTGSKATTSGGSQSGTKTARSSLLDRRISRRWEVWRSLVIAEARNTMRQYSIGGTVDDYVERVRVTHAEIVRKVLSSGISWAVMTRNRLDDIFSSYGELEELCHEFSQRALDRKKKLA
jgi:hypothetical protein